MFELSLLATKGAEYRAVFVLIILIVIIITKYSLLTRINEFKALRPAQAQIQTGFHRFT